MPPNNTQLVQQVADLAQKIQGLESRLNSHQHTISDNTSPLRKTIIIDQDQYFGLGNTQIYAPTLANGTVDDLYASSYSVGPDSIGKPLNKSANMELNFLHKPNGTQSFIRSFRSPIVVSFENTSISVSSGGNTLTTTGFNFQTNELAGALINIYNAANDLVETQVIQSNNSIVITIVGTWLASTSGGKFLVFVPVYFGSAEVPFQRFYTQEGTVGGVRFGTGPTGTGQNGLLYMDATGDLYWRNKAGTATKLN